LGDVYVGGVAVGPGAAGFAVLGQCLQSFQARALLVRRLEDYRYHDGFAAAMPFKGPGEFDSADELGSEETGGDEQEDDVGLVELPDDLGSPLLAGNDLAVAPFADEAAMAQAADPARIR